MSNFRWKKLFMENSYGHSSKSSRSQHQNSMQEIVFLNFLFQLILIQFSDEIIDGTTPVLCANINAVLV